MIKALQQTKLFWSILRAGAVSLYLLGLALALFSRVPVVGVILLAVIILLHLLELKTAFLVGRDRGINDRTILLMDLLFGFTWWVPLKNGVNESK